MYDNPIIKKRFEEKMKRQDKTALSIQISWSINNATAFIPEKLRGTEEGFKMIEKWYPKFLEIYRAWMLENMPLELVSSEEAKFRTRDNMVDEGIQELKEEEANIKIAEAEAEYKEQLPIIEQ